MGVSKQTKTYASRYKTDVSVNQTNNVGFDATTRKLCSGDGADSSMAASDDVLEVQPVNDDTTGTFLVKNQGGNNILAVDTDNGKVLAGASQVAVNTQYAHFGVSYNDATGAALFAADTHYAIPFMTMNFGAVGASLAMGSSTSSSFNDTDPSATLTITTTAMDVMVSYWYVMDNITVDRVIWWQGADTATGDSTAAYLMQYTVDATTGSTGGDLSAGSSIAESSTVTNAGYEQAYYNEMALTARVDVDAGQVILFTFAADTVNSDVTINATVKYHIR